MKEILRIPSALLGISEVKNRLIFDGGEIIEESSTGKDWCQSVFIEEQALFFVLEGSVVLSHGIENLVVRQNEMTLLKKGKLYDIQKVIDSNSGHYRGMLFCLTDDYIRTFLMNSEKIKAKPDNGELRSGVHAMNDCLHTFIQSLDPYFKYSSEVHLGQFQLKLEEMFYYLGIGNESLFNQLIQLDINIKTDLQQIIEKYYTSPISLEDLAIVSGRSLSSFKRDFKQIFNAAPATWLRHKRLAKAKELLESTEFPVSEICFAIGFENVSHFSRAFKQYYGNSPSFYRN